MMSIKEINMCGVTHKWLALMNYIRHSAPAVYQINFPDSKKASDVAKRLYSTVERNPTWFDVVIINKGCTVYVIKNDNIQKVVLKDV